MIAVRSITAGYFREKVLNGLSLEFHSGEFCALAGPNGAGKSTLLKTIIGYHQVWEGVVKVGGTDIKSIPRRLIARKLTIIPQEIQMQFDYSVWEMVLMGRYPYLSFWQKYSREDIDYVESLLSDLNLLSFRDTLYSELSGGEKQRVNIARALAQDTAAILLDESLVHLDINHQLEIIALLKGVNKGQNKLIILVSHNLNLAADYCDRMVLMKGGEVIEDGSPETVLTVENLERVYGVRANIITNPFTGKPNVMYPPVS